MKYLLKHYAGLLLSGRLHKKFFSKILYAWLTALALSALLHCGNNIFKSLEDYNKPPFYLDVLSFAPSDGATEVLLDAVVTVEFNDSINMSTVGGSTTFIVSDGASVVPGAFSYNTLSKTVTFTPAANFSESVDYSVSLTTGIKNLAGDSMTADFSWAFSTIFYLKVISVFPLTGAVDVPVNSSVTVVFNDNIDMLTVDALAFIVSDGAVPITGSFAYDSALKIVTFTPAVNLTASTSYTATLTTAIKNPVGESMFADYTWSFTTAAAAVPEIYLLSPLGGDMPSGSIYDFGSLINPDTITALFTIGNSGNEALNISAAVTGTHSSEFIITSTSTALIFPGGTFTVAVRFTPDTIAGAKTAALQITNDDPDENPFVINLTGLSLLATELIPEIQITKSGVILVTTAGNVDFGSVTAGDSADIQLVMSNLGTADLVISEVAITGLNYDLFSTDFTTSLPYTITPGSSYTFNVTFSPTGKVNAKGVLTFTSNDSDESPFIINLKGRCK